MQFGLNMRAEAKNNYYIKNNFISAMNQSTVLKNLPPHLQLYADRFISKTPLSAADCDPLYTCTKHSKPAKPTQTIGGMKKGFLCSKKETPHDPAIGYQDPID